MLTLDPAINKKLVLLFLNFFSYLQNNSARGCSCRSDPFAYGLKERLKDGWCHLSDAYPLSAAILFFCAILSAIWSSKEKWARIWDP